MIDILVTFYHFTGRAAGEILELAVIMSATACLLALFAWSV